MKSKRYSVYQLFKIRYSFSGFRLAGVVVDEEEKTVQVSLKRVGCTSICPSCKRRCKTFEAFYTRRVRLRDVFEYECRVDFMERKIRCKYGYRGLEELCFVRPYSHCTRSLEELVAGFCVVLSISEASKKFRLDWKTVKEIDKQSILEHLPGLKEFNPVRIG